MNADQVSEHLWVGGVPTDPAAVDKKFNALVLCAKEYQDVFPQHLYPTTDLILAPLDDDKPSNTEKYYALRAALAVRKHLDEGHEVLVTCAAGVNRSALVAALAMMLGKDTPKSAIDSIRKKRKPLSKATPLFNNHFVDLINEVWKEISTRKQTAAA